MFDAVIKKTIIAALQDEEIKEKSDEWLEERVKIIVKKINDALAKD